MALARYAPRLGGMSLVLAVTVSAVVIALGDHGIASADDPSPIAGAALRYLGTHGGQCKAFVQRVVAESTGRRIGLDYRLGYFEAGAVEVSPEEAVRGDIIQVASDADTSPSASYVGLHTAIILENLGGGVFSVVESNGNLDEMVGMRARYNPYAARSYGMQVHIYRIPGGSVADAAGVSGPTYSWSAGEPGFVAAGDDCLNLRTGPSLSEPRQACLPTSAPVTVLEGRGTSDGYSWLEVQTAAGHGWMAAMYLAPAASGE